MKIETIHINSMGEGIDEALRSVEEASLKQGFNSYDAKHMRLLSEETLELVGNIMDRMDADFTADIRDDKCEIKLVGKPPTTSIRKSGPVAQYLNPTGIGKKISALFESPFEDLLKNEEAISEIGIRRVDEGLLKEMGRTGDGFVWTLDAYELSVFDSRSVKKEENWEEINSSIIASLSDEVRILVFPDCAELDIIKHYDGHGISKKPAYAIHPDFYELRRIPIPKSLFQVRIVQLIYRSLMQRETSTDAFNVKTERFSSGISPKGRVKSLIYSSSDLKEDEAAPCILLIHGGAFLFPALPYHYRFARLIAQKVRCRVVMPMYHLAPDRVPPIQQEEICTVYVSLLKEHERFHIDPDRIIIAGDSAGGTLAAALCLMARDRDIRLPLAQALFYPSLDARLCSESLKKYPDVPVCNGDAIKVYYKLCRPDEYYGSNDYRSPLEAASLDGLPDAYIETAEFDALHDDGIAYAERLRDAGCNVILNETKGTVHAFEMAKNSSITKEALEKRIEFFNGILSESDAR